MRKDKRQAFTLRKNGLSYNAISKKLGVPKSTLSEWFSELSWSKSLRKDLTRRAFLKIYPQLQAMNEARSRQWEEWREKARKGALADFQKLRTDPLFVSGVMIYWGEGDRKPDNPVRVSNIDPQMLRIFIKFLRKCCRIPREKIKAHLTIYPDLNESECKKYWIPKIGVKPELFNKTQIILGRHKTKKLHYGICAIEIASRQLKEKLLVWIQKFSKQL